HSWPQPSARLILRGKSGVVRLIAAPHWPARARRSRLELRSGDPAKNGRYKKIDLDEKKVDDFFIDVFVQAHEEAPKLIVIDLDATDDPLHGAQEGRFFHGYYREYCYLPLYLFCGDFLLCARLRTADKEAASGALDEIKRIVKRVREDWPEVEI